MPPFPDRRTRAYREDLVQKAMASVADPVYFAREMLGVDLWEDQEMILRSCRQNRETAVRSCHGSGKTKTAAIAALDQIANKRPGSALALVMSSSWEQVLTQVFGEAHGLIGNSPYAAIFSTVNQGEILCAGGNRMLGISPNNPTRVHGFHAEDVLFILDEFAGIEQAIVTATLGIKASGRTRFLYLMNPTEVAGPSVDIFDDPKVTAITIDGLASPNMEGYHIYETEEENLRDDDKAHNLLYLSEQELDADPRPYLITRRFIRDLYQDEMRKFGSLKPQSEWWPRVRGLHPTEGDSMLLQRQWVASAHQRRVDRQKYDVCGIDVAGPGEDETTACMRSGMAITREAAWGDADPMPKVLAFLGPPRANLWVNIDRQGVGWGMYTELKRLGYQVNGLNAGDAPYDKSRFDSFKSEMYWNVRLRFQDGEVGGPIDPVTQRQLLGIRWDQDNPKRLIHIESKQEARKRGMRSPDRGEAVILSFAASPQRQTPQDWRYPESQAAKKRNGQKWIDEMRRRREKAGLVGSPA